MHARKIQRLDGYYDRRSSSNPYPHSSEPSKRSMDTSSSGRFHSESHTYRYTHEGYSKSKGGKSASKAYVSHRVTTDERDGDKRRTARVASEKLTETAHQSSHVGVWTEHVSSSGRIFYFNTCTEVSQWEKPAELGECERKQSDKKKRRGREEGDSGRGAEKGSGGPGPSTSPCDSFVSSASGSPSSFSPSSTSSSSSPPSVGQMREVGVAKDKEHSRSLTPSDKNRSGASKGSPPNKAEGGEREGLPQTAAAAAEVAPTTSAPATTPVTTAAVRSSGLPQSSSFGLLSTAIGVPCVVASTSDPGYLLPVPALSAAYANFCRDDLIQQYKIPQMEDLQRHSQRLKDASFQLGLDLTENAAQLKMARSLVRLAEIQSTLKEQGILFLRQQLMELDDAKIPILIQEYS